MEQLNPKNNIDIVNVNVELKIFHLLGNFRKNWPRF